MILFAGLLILLTANSGLLITHKRASFISSFHPSFFSESILFFLTACFSGRSYKLYWAIKLSRDLLSICLLSLIYIFPSLTVYVFAGGCAATFTAAVINSTNAGNSKY